MFVYLILFRLILFDHRTHNALRHHERHASLLGFPFHDGQRVLGLLSLVLWLPSPFDLPQIVVVHLLQPVEQPVVLIMEALVVHV